MFLGYFTERPYQDPDAGISGAFLTEGGQLFAPGDAPGVIDLGTSNGLYNPRVAHQLYNRYLDEKVYAEEMGFDGLMLNEHHASLFCMGGAINVEAAILARITKKAKIVLLGNVLPIWDDPMWLAEELAEIDLISGGRLVPGWVRGTGRESVAHNAQSPFNWERFQEAHDFVIKTWTTDGPFRWEGKHFQYRYVNPWSRPMQQPHP
ncbi:MAG: LLM class flavin-dependent oxidoreductase, partial [Chloroflexi bacterium]|nr:LLM class flavin-dependent oxidoreductase [Chloroflexota bacterium]